MISFRSLVFLAMGSVASCGGGTPEPQHVDSAPTATAAEAAHGPTFHQELGSIDDRAVSNTFNDLNQHFLGCQTAGLKRIPYLSGVAKFFMRVGEDGRTKWTYLEQSSLGDYETERCMLDVVEGAQWPKPIGGDATVERDVTFDPPPDTRQPADWPPDKVAATVGKHKKDVDKCVDAAPTTKFSVTAYVEPHGSEGRVRAAGVAISNKEGSAQAQCVIDAVKSMKMPSPGSYAAKVAFGL